MENRIAQALAKLFDRHRLVFWDDSKQELRADFASLQLAGVEKLELTNNEFGAKHRILREQPEQKFLLYREGAQPADLENWLLDVQLAHGGFRADQAAIWLADLELDHAFDEVVQSHIEFYQAAKRPDLLKRLLKPDDTVGHIRLKMLAVCAGAEPRIDAVLENLLAEHADEKDDKLKLIGRCGLEPFLWEQMDRHFGYQSDTRGIRDFAIELFKSCYAMGTDGPVRLHADALVFLKRWKDSRLFAAAFETLSNECARVLDIERDLEKRDFRALLDLDYFRLIDLKIISDLVRAVAFRTVTAGDVSLWVRQRRQGHWYAEHRHEYEAVESAARFLLALDEANLTMESLEEGVLRYSRSWFSIDQLYRQFTWHVRESGHATLMGALQERIENLYANTFLLKVNDRWQSFVDSTSRWDAPPIRRQNEFFERWVRPFLRKEGKVCVIVSDALRYEIGDELLSRIRKEDRYSATLEPALAMLPSFTQLGMAALLPHQQLALADDDSGAVLVDGQSSQGTVNRQKILAQLTSHRATARKADEVMKLGGDTCRELLRDHDLLYVYHNAIDATGDKRDSEEGVFQAVEETLDYLVRLIKKLTGANATNLLVTADHGFLYQDRPIDESDFSGVEAEGEVVRFRNRRFVLGKGLKPTAGLRKFSSAELGLAGDVEVQVPKSINRLRLKGAGSRYVHGGASLQEVVIPVLRINKKRQSDLSFVEVNILPGASSIISAGQHAVVLYQVQPMSDKVQGRALQAGIYTDAGELISDTHDVVFDLKSENPREREMKVSFLLTRQADEFNGKEVILKLSERHASTSHYKEYKSVRYTLRRSFTRDFDF
jgi:uncharacterized protein (TIGR02687 family)